MCIGAWSTEKSYLGPKQDGTWNNSMFCNQTNVEQSTESALKLEEKYQQLGKTNG